MKNKKLIVIVLVVTVLAFIIWKRWSEFKIIHVTNQQKENENLISNGQAPQQIVEPTVINFITGSTGTSSTSTSGNSEGATKSALIDALAVKHNFTFTTGQEQALMTYSIAQLEELLSKTESEVAAFLGL
jgi:uncharacterized alpha/beta hydrolase family protein